MSHRLRLTTIVCLLVCRGNTLFGFISVFRLPIRWCTCSSPFLKCLRRVAALTEIVDAFCELLSTVAAFGSTQLLDAASVCAGACVSCVELTPEFVLSDVVTESSTIQISKFAATKQAKPASSDSARGERPSCCTPCPRFAVLVNF